jgi:hypothetical protein
MIEPILSIKLEKYYVGARLVQGKIADMKKTLRQLVLPTTDSCPLQS